MYGQCLHKVISAEIPNSKKNVDVVFCKEKVLCIEFDYSPLGINHWNTIQRTIFNIGVNGLKCQCKHIALIDPDEFIFVHEDPENNIERFLLNYKSTRIKSNLLTNKNNDDIINNNILNIAKYIG